MKNLTLPVPVSRWILIQTLSYSRYLFMWPMILFFGISVVLMLTDENIIMSLMPLMEVLPPWLPFEGGIGELFTWYFFISFVWYVLFSFVGFFVPVKLQVTLLQKLLFITILLIGMYGYMFIFNLPTAQVTEGSSIRDVYIFFFGMGLVTWVASVFSLSAAHGINFLTEGLRSGKFKIRNTL